MAKEFDTSSFLLGILAGGAIATLLSDGQSTAPAGKALPSSWARRVRNVPTAGFDPGLPNQYMDYQSLDAELLRDLLRYEVDGRVFVRPGQALPMLRGEIRGSSMMPGQITPNQAAVLSFAYDRIGDSNDPGVLLAVSHDPMGRSGMKTHFLRADEAMVGTLRRFVENRVRWAQSVR